jgi:hypothetical protein
MAAGKRPTVSRARAPTNKVSVLSKTIIPASVELRDKDGWLYRLEMVDCGKGAIGRCRKCASGPSHGPYWYRYHWYDGKMHKRYVGKKLPSSVSREVERRST